MFESVRFCCLCYFELQGRKRKKYFQNFVQIVRSLESNNCNATTNGSKPNKTYWWMLWMSMVRNNGFAEVVAFCHVTCRYFDRFLLQGVDKNWRQACLFYLAPGLISEVYWQVNSRKSIFRIADPIKDNHYGTSSWYTRSLFGQMECVSIRLQWGPKLLHSPCVSNKRYYVKGKFPSLLSKIKDDDVHVSILFLYRDCIFDIIYN